jgi:hypothetical protein
MSAGWRAHLIVWPVQQCMRWLGGVRSGAMWVGRGECGMGHTFGHASEREVHQIRWGVRLPIVPPLLQVGLSET